MGSFVMEDVQREDLAGHALPQSGRTAPDPAPTASPARLTVVSDVINDDGGSATAAAMSLTIDRQTVTSGVANALAPGTSRWASAT